MALDFAQVDELGKVTGGTVRLDLKLHHSLIQPAPSLGQFRMLAKMHDYYEDVTFRRCELAELERELEEYRAIMSEHEHVAVLDSMLELVQDSMKKGLSIEAIAD